MNAQANERDANENKCDSGPGEDGQIADKIGAKMSVGAIVHYASALLWPRCPSGWRSVRPVQR